MWVQCTVCMHICMKRTLKIKGKIERTFDHDFGIEVAVVSNSKCMQKIALLCESNYVLVTCRHAQWTKIILSDAHVNKFFFLNGIHQREKFRGFFWHMSFMSGWMSEREPALTLYTNWIRIVDKIETEVEEEEERKNHCNESHLFGLMLSNVSALVA